MGVRTRKAVEIGPRVEGEEEAQAGMLAETKAVANHAHALKNISGY